MAMVPPASGESQRGSLGALYTGAAPVPIGGAVSIRLIAWAWQQKLPPTDKLILLALADHAADQTRQAWPSITHLADKTGCGRRTVFDALARLERLELVIREARPRPQTTVYRLADSAAGALDSAATAPISAAGALPIVRQPHTEPSIEPSVTKTIDREAGASPRKLNGHHYMEQAERVIQWCATKARKNWQARSPNGKPTATADLVVARLKEGYTERQCMVVFARKFREWSADDKMAEYARPATVFRKSHFAEYLAQCGTNPAEE